MFERRREWLSRMILGSPSDRAADSNLQTDKDISGREVPACLGKVLELCIGPVLKKLERPV